MMNLQFLGGAGTVTGSRSLVTTRYGRVLVDCGLFQGLKVLRERNWQPFPSAAANIDCVVLTHAHIDHSGYLPLLVKQGFRGRILCTPATAELCRILLLDSAHLQEEEAKHANRRGYSKHHPALPLYTTADAMRAIDLLHPVDFHRTADAVGAGVSFFHASHILGASSAILSTDRTTLAFSGDLGRTDDPVLLPPEPFAGADYLVVESTYGDRIHPAADARDRLAAAITRTIHRQGTVVIPAFAVGRAQLFLYHLNALRESGRIPDVPIFLDSPMASEVTEVLKRHADELRVTPAETAAMLKAVTITTSPDESKALDTSGQPKIIISASGMATGGRVLFHIARYAPDPHNLIVLGGFQAVGTRGASIASGATDVRIFGEYVPIRAEVLAMQEFSSHADAPALIAWMRAAPNPPAGVFISHGEPASSEALRVRIKRELGWNAQVPEPGRLYRLEQGSGQAQHSLQSVHEGAHVVTMT